MSGPAPARREAERLAALNRTPRSDIANEDTMSALGLPLELAQLLATLAHAADQLDHEEKLYQLAARSDACAALFTLDKPSARLFARCAASVLIPKR